MAREAWRLAALVLLLGAPAASAASAEGSFLIEGPVFLTPGGVLETEPAVVYSQAARPDAPAEWSELRLRAPLVTVHRFHARHVEVSASPPGPGLVRVPSSTVNATYALHEVELTLVRQGDGAFVPYLALDAAPGAKLRLEWEGPLSTEARSAGWAGMDRSSPHDAYATPTYGRFRDEAHLLSNASGRALFTGAGVLKLYGVVAQVDALENRSRLDLTSRRATDAPAGVTDLSWAVLEAPRGMTLEYRAASPVSVLSRHADLEWSGALRARSATGSLLAEGAPRRWDDAPAVLEGDLHAEASLALHGRRSQLLLDLEGELAAGAASTATASARTLPVPRAPLGPLLLVGAAVLAGAGGLALHRRRRVRPHASPAPHAAPETCMAHAEAALARGDPAAALPWLVQARALAPTSASVRAATAFVLQETGRVEDALRAYQDASRLDPTEGEHALNAARLAHRAGRSPDEVEDLLEQALSRTPRCVIEVEGDGYFAALAGRPRFEHLLERAWARLAADSVLPDDADP